MFPFVCFAAWTSFLPGWFWDVVLPRVRRRPANPDVAADVERPRVRTAFATQVTAGVLILYVLAWSAPQVTILGFRTTFVMPTPLVRVGQALRIAEVWAMFAPDPTPVDFWPVIEGDLVNGEMIDPFRNAPVSWEKPDRVPDLFPSFKWKLYYYVLLFTKESQAGYRELYASLGRYLCERWNAEHTGQERMLRMRIGHVFAITSDTGPGTPQRFTSLEYECPRWGRRIR